MVGVARVYILDQGSTGRVQGGGCCCPTSWHHLLSYQRSIAARTCLAGDASCFCINALPAAAHPALSIPLCVVCQRAG
jgi:hypothetical protein